MKFEEEFPSMKQCERIVDTYQGDSNDWDEICYHNKDIQEHCVDKQIIINVMTTVACFIDLDTQKFIMKELGLEKHNDMMGETQSNGSLEEKD